MSPSDSLPDEGGPAPAGSDPAAQGPGQRATRRQALSVATATGLYGISFGALSVAAGIGVGPTMLLSMLMFSGGSQFALVGVVGAGGTVGAAVAAAGLLGVRNAVYGPLVAPSLQVSGPTKLLAAHLTIDESTAVALAQPTPDRARTGFWWTGAGIWVGWNLCTLLGALAGQRLGDPGRYGLDAAAAAAFLALVWPRLSGPQGRTARLVAGTAVVAALLATPLLPPGLPVLAAAVVAVLAGLVAERRATAREPFTEPPVGTPDRAATDGEVTP